MNAVKGPIYSPLSISIKALNAGRERANFLYGNLLTFPISSFTKSWWFGGQSKASVGAGTGSCSWSTKGHPREAQTPPNLPTPITSKGSWQHLPVPNHLHHLEHGLGEGTAQDGRCIPGPASLEKSDPEKPRGQQSE